MNKLPPDASEIVDLVELLCQGEITSEENVRLEAILRTDKQARQYYVRYLYMHASLPMFSGAESDKQELVQLQQILGASGSSADPDQTESCLHTSVSKEDSEDRSFPSGVLGFLGECFQQGSSFLTKPGIFSLLVAIGLPGIVLLMLVVSLINQAPLEQQSVVATVVRTRDCVGCLGDGHTWLLAGTDLTAGERLTLRKGVVEIEFADGARVILEAPTAFEVRHANGGFLQMGRLAANVPNEAHGFSVETPLATVVDLGTDFGVLVAADGTAEAHVFTGEVEVATKTMPENPTSLTKRLCVGQAARIQVPDALHAVASIEEISAVADEFVRRFPVKLSKNKSVRKEPSETTSRLITSVDRQGGATGNRVPVGMFDDETDPLPSGESGLQLNVPLYSDRVYVIDDMSPELAGADYVRTFLNDKFDVEDGFGWNNYSYHVTFTTDREQVFLLVLVDNRFERGGGEQQAAVDQIVSKFASPGEFINTGLYVDANDSHKPRQMSAFGKWVPTKDKYGDPIKYSFCSAPPGKSSFVIVAMPEAPATLRNNTAEKPKR